MITQTQTKAIYDLYCSLTGFDRQFTVGLRFKIEQWLFEGYTGPDLRLVVSYLQRQIRLGKREPIKCLLPRNIIEDTEQFADNLAAAKAEARIKREHMPASKQAVLRATARVEPEKQERSTAQILDGVNAFKDFQKMAKDL